MGAWHVSLCFCWSVCVAVCLPDGLMMSVPWPACWILRVLTHSLSHSLVRFLASCVLRLSHTDGGGGAGRQEQQDKSQQQQ